MSVPVSKRKEGKLEVIVEAKKLAAYTIQICCNEKIFIPKYKNAVTDKIIELATSIFMDVWSANNVLVNGDIEKFRYRQSLQTKAIENCNNLLAMMQIAQTIFHLAVKRIQFWGNKTVCLRHDLRAWRESDAKRFNDGQL